MSQRVREMIVLLALTAAGCVANAALAGPSAKSATAKWPGGAVTAANIAFKAGQGKVFLTFTGNVRADAQTGGQSITVTHADKATADVDSRWQFNTIKATGSVRFSVARQAGAGTEKAIGRCDRATIYNPAGKKPAGDERFLVADLAGNVFLSMPPPGGRPASGGVEEPMTLEGEHGRIWLTADGYEGTVSGESE